MSAHVLVVDDIAANVKILEAKLTAAFYRVSTAFSGKQCLEIAERDQPDLILLDVMMPEMDGYECCRRLKTTPETAHIPVVMVTALDQREDRIRGLEAGADDFLTKPPNDLALSARVRSLVRVKMMLDELRMRDATFRDLGVEDIDLSALTAPPAGRVLIADPRPSRGEKILEALCAKLPGVECAVATSAEGAFEIARYAPPDAMIIAAKLGKQDGLRLCAELRSRPETRQSASILVTEHDDYQTVAAALDIGANDYLMRPIDPHELVARTATQLRRKAFTDMLRENVHTGMRMAVTDGLTGLYNRRYADQHLARLMRQTHGIRGRLSVLMLDLDRFKQVNDTHGHAAGDAVLVEFARRIQHEVRGVDLLARYGGEEFIVMLPDVDSSEALGAAERIRAAVAGRPFEIGEGREALNVTVSIGAAEWQGPDESGASLVDRADSALYASKNAGRDRATLAPAPTGGGDATQVA